MAIAPQEIFQPQHVSRAGWSDQDGAGLAGLQKTDAPQDQRPHDAFAQRSFLHQNIAQPSGNHHQCFGVGHGDSTHQRRAIRKLRELAMEAAGAVPGNNRRRRNRAALAHFDLANLYDERGDRGKALSHYQAALEISPQYADAHYNLALLYQGANQPMKAVRHWTDYLRLDPASHWSSIARRELAKLRKAAVVQGAGRQ